MPGDRVSFSHDQPGSKEKLTNSKNEKSYKSFSNPSGIELEINNVFGGQVDIIGKHSSRVKYVKLSDKIGNDVVDCEIMEKMHLGHPILVISITGGMREFDEEGQLESDKTVKLIGDLCKVMTKVKKETWFLTGGLHTGSAKVFAEAIGRTKSKNTQVIGLAPWKLVHKKETLFQKNDEVNVPTYSIFDVIDNKETYHLTEGHTHFFLVDTDGDRPREKVIKFKTNFQELIRTTMVGKTLSASARRKSSLWEGMDANDYLPAIQLVMNGGYETMYEIYLNLFGEKKKKTPPMSVVVIAETGGVADYLAKLWRVMDKKHENKEVEAVQMEAQKKFPDIYDMMLACVQEKRKFINIYPDGDQKLEEVILKAMLRNEEESRNQKDESLNILQMNILFAWGRVDMAMKKMKTHVGRDAAEKTFQLLQNLCISSLRSQKLKFFKLVTDMGFNIRQHLNKQMLSNLYRKEYGDQSTPQTNTLLSFESLESANGNILSYIEKEINNCLTIKIVDYTNTTNLEHPYKEIFLWAVMCNKYKIAQFVWYNYCDHPIGFALIARALFLKLSANYERYHPHPDESVTEELELNARSFGSAAMDLLQTCSESSASYTNALISLQMPMLGEMSYMALGTMSAFEDFIAHQRLRDVATLLWNGRFKGEFFLYLKVVMAIIFPPMLFAIKLRKKNVFYENGPYITCHEDSSSKNPCNKILGSIYSFYTAPVTKFWIAALINMFFLAIYSLYVLYHLEDERICLEEVIVFAYIISFAIVDITSISKEYGLSCRHKMNRRTTSNWKNLNSLCVCVYIFALVMKVISRWENTDSTIDKASACIFAFSFFLWVIRLLKVMSLNMTIGIYIIMLQKMIGDVIKVIAIAFVFIIGYALVRYPMHKKDWNINPHDMNSSEVHDHGSYSDSKMARHLFVVPVYQLLGQMVDRSNFPKKMDNYKVFMMFFTYIYLIFTTLLLLNLLIAIFNNTYEDLRLKADRIWKLEHCRVVISYSSESSTKKCLVSICNFIKNTFCCIKSQNRSKKSSKHCVVRLDDYFQKDCHLTFLSQFENECLLQNKMKYDLLKKKRKQWHKVMTSDVQDFVVSLNETFGNPRF